MRCSGSHSMGGTARDVAKADAPHALAVTDVIDALDQSPRWPAKPAPAARTLSLVRRPLQAPPSYFRGGGVLCACASGAVTFSDDVGVLCSGLLTRDGPAPESVDHQSEGGCDHDRGSDGG